MNPTLQEFGIDRLSVDQRLDLIGQIWDSIAEADETITIPEWHLRELERPTGLGGGQSRGGDSLGSRQGPPGCSTVRLPVVVLPEAQGDLLDARDWYDQQRDGLGDEF